MAQVLHVKTPVVYSQSLKNRLDKDVYFKLDVLQPSGSFKIRGLGKLCQAYATEGKRKFISSSGGNAGIAAAYAGMKLGIPVTVIVPETSHQIYLDTIKTFHAEVIVGGKVWDEAHKIALKMVEEDKDSAYVPPFDHPTIWAGHASLVDELAEDGLKPDAILLAVGGGGLACGVIEGLTHHGWHDIPVICVETKGADSFNQSVQAGKRIMLKEITSRTTSLGARQVTEQLMTCYKNHPMHSIVVTDDQAEHGACMFARDKRVLVELSSGAPLSLIYDRHPVIEPFQRILVVVCGGVNTAFFRIKQ